MTSAAAKLFVVPRAAEAPDPWPLAPDFVLTPPMPPKPRKPPRRRKPPVSLSTGELLALLQMAKDKRLRDYVMILVTYWHGLRASETLQLTEANFEVQAGFIQVQRGKGSELTLQPLQGHPNPLLDERAAVADWLANRERYGVKGNAQPGSRRARRIAQSTENVQKRAPTPGFAPGAEEKPAGGYEPPSPSSAGLYGQGNGPGTPSERLFPINRFRFWQIVHGYALAAGVPKRKAKTHMLKHTIAKHLIREGVPINEVQAWLGWKSLETANWYLMADEEELGDRIGRAIRGKSGFQQIQQRFLFPESGGQP